MSKKVVIASLTLGVLLATPFIADKEVSAANTKTYSVAVSNNSKPLSYRQNGKLKGYEVEVLKAVDKKISGVKFKTTDVSQTAELVGLDSGKYNIAANGFYSNSEREKKYHIGKENDGLSLVKVYSNKKTIKNKITNLDDLSGKTLAPVNANGGMYNLLKTWNADNKDKKIKIATTDGLPMQQLLKGVNSGKYDALIDPSNLGESEIIKGLKLKNVKTFAPIRAYPTYFLYPKKNAKLADQVDKALKQLKKDGTLKRLSQKYFEENVFQYKEKTE